MNARGSLPPLTEGVQRRTRHRQWLRAWRRSPWTLALLCVVLLYQWLPALRPGARIWAVAHPSMESNSVPPPAVSSVPPAGGTDDTPSMRRHVLLLTVDTLRADYLSTSGYDEPTTPFLDALMRQGFHFTRAMTPIARTTQALTSLMTGCYPHTTRVRFLADTLPAGFMPLAELARRKGYATAAVVSNSVLERRGLERGFGPFDVVEYPRDATGTTDAVLRQLQTHTAQDPLFVWVHYLDPHAPYAPPPQLAAAFDPTYEGPYKYNFGDTLVRPGNDTFPPDLPKEQAVYRNPLSDRVNAHIRRLYAADIRHADDEIARLLASLRERFGDDWLVIFAADHGESLGEHGYFYDHGDYVSDPELHVPLAVILPPGDPLQGTGTIDALVSLVDVMPTLVELLALRVPSHLGYDIDGRSLVPYFRGKTLPERPVFAESGRPSFPRWVRRRVRFDISGEFRAVLFRDWKLVWTPGRTGDDQFELYNLSSDPAESTNVYGSNRTVSAPLEAALRRWAGPETSTVVAQQARLRAKDKEILRSLGYIR